MCIRDRLTGSIPDEICNLGITSIYLTMNQLCPPYPSCLYEDEDSIGQQDTSDCY